MGPESTSASTSMPSPLPTSRKRCRDPEDEVCVNNLHSQKRYLSEIMASSLNGLTVGDSLPYNLMDSPTRSESRFYSSLSFKMQTRVNGCLKRRVFDPHKFTRRRHEQIRICHLQVQGDGKDIWLKWSPPRVCGFAWKAAHDVLPTKWSLLVRGIITLDFDSICSICNNNLEDQDHLFIFCLPAINV